MYKRILVLFLCFCVGVLLTGCYELYTVSESEQNVSISTEIQTEQENITETESVTEPELTEIETTEPETTEPETTEPEKTEPETTPEKNYIANKNSGKLHSTNCDSLPYEKNRIYFSTIEQAYSAGYTDHHKECMGG